jgi:hypothetical protein
VLFRHDFDDGGVASIGMTAEAERGERREGGEQRSGMVHLAR